MINIIAKIVYRIRYRYCMMRFARNLRVLLNRVNEIEQNADWMTRVGIRNAKEELLKDVENARTREELSAAFAGFDARMDEIVALSGRAPAYN
ncbi:MAG: hypothetical protein HZA48_03210 [Planctomycetes bacterium]|nr:hypothetical protein [Planctomycetota bacterium]